MTQRDTHEQRAEPIDGLADDGMAPIVTNTGVDTDDSPDDDADASTG